MLTRVSGTTTIAASGRSVASRRAANALAVAPDQADAAVRAPARGCRRGPRAAGRARAPRRRARRARRRSSPATMPAATVAADEPSPRSSGIRLTKRKRCPSSGATQRERAQRQVRLVARKLVGALRPRPSTSGSPSSAGSTCSSFQRSSAAPAQSNPGPEVRRRRRRATTNVHRRAPAPGLERLEDRLDGRLDERRLAACASRRAPCPSGRGR